MDRLIDLAKAWPDKDRQKKHIYLPADVAVILENNARWPGGTVFDRGGVNVLAEGGIGDVVEADLKDLAARFIVNLPSPAVMPYDKIPAAKRAEYDKVKTELSNFEVAPDIISTLSDKDARMKLVTKGDGILSRDNETKLTDAEFKKTGVLFFVPKITDAEVQTILQKGKTLGNRSTQFSFTFTRTENGKEKVMTGSASVSAKDYAPTAAQFIGDRDFKKPGYSEFKLSGTVGKEQANDKLDVLKVEQRLRYLGFPAYGMESPFGSRSMQHFMVDGEWGDYESKALRLFEALINNGDPNRPDGLVARDGVTKVGSRENALFDGLISSKTEETVSWLSAWNTPHWVNILESMTDNSNLLDAQKHAYNEQNYGSSWMRDLLLSYQYADPALRKEGRKLLFGGATDANYQYTYQYTGYPEGDKKDFFYRNTQYHDNGMGLDLRFDDGGENTYIDPRWQRNYSEDPSYSYATSLSAGAKAWSDEIARNLIAKPDSGAGTSDELQRAQQIGKLLPSGVWTYVPKLPPEYDSSEETFEQYVTRTGGNTVYDGRQIDYRLNNQVTVGAQLLALYSMTKPESMGFQELSGKLLGGEAAAKSLFDGLIDSISVGSKDGTFSQNLSRTNQYKALNSVLQRVGIKTIDPSTKRDLHDHAYLKLKAPPKRAIEKALTADQTNAATTPPAASVESLTAQQLPATVANFAAIGPMQWGAAAASWSTVLANLQLRNLDNAEVGASDGNSITLDADAAGLGWFIDLTPNSNEEFVQGANPNEWIAKPGSAAEGKMDLLTTLLHEYGHVLGLSHSTDSHGIMSATLKPGVRHLVSAQDLAKLNTLLAQTGPLNMSAQGRAALTVANAQAFNSDLSSDTAWSKRGGVAVDANSVTLSERAESQSSIQQVFVLGADDKFLRFTIAAQDLHQVTSGGVAGANAGPSDAFEVALLDANTVTRYVTSMA